jgi:hypothetical protein
VNLKSRGHIGHWHLFSRHFCRRNPTNLTRPRSYSLAYSNPSCSSNMVAGELSLQFKYWNYFVFLTRCLILKFNDTNSQTQMFISLFLERAQSSIQTHINLNYRPVEIISSILMRCAINMLPVNFTAARWEWNETKQGNWCELMSISFLLERGSFKVFSLGLRGRSRDQR